MEAWKLQVSFPVSHTKWPNWDLNIGADTSSIQYLGIILFCLQEVFWVHGRDNGSFFGRAGSGGMSLKVKISDLETDS